MTKPRVVYTNRCSDGTTCRSVVFEDSVAFIPDGQTKCDSCLLYSVGLTSATYDGCGDPLGMFPLYDEKDVIAALRGLGLG